MIFSASVDGPPSTKLHESFCICRRYECGRVMGATGAKIWGYQWWIHYQDSLTSGTASLWPVRNHSSGRALQVRIELLHLSGRVCVHLMVQHGRWDNGLPTAPTSSPHPNRQRGSWQDIWLRGCDRLSRHHLEYQPGTGVWHPRFLRIRAAPASC